MRIKSLLSRRPSPAMGVALTALFVSLGGVGYAATTLPAGSVGTAQLQHSSVTHSKLRFNSVSFQDIQPGAVGRVRANLNQLQARVSGACGSGNAIGAIQNNGQVNCNPARPAEFGATTPAGVSAPTAGATVLNLTLPTGSTYLAFANPTVTSAAGNQSVTCSLTLGANKSTRTVHLANTAGVSESIPLQVAGPAGTANVTCSTASGAPTTVVSNINAIETSKNN